MATLPVTTQTHFSWLRRHGVMLALVIAYVAMTLLVVQQNRVIVAQQKLIRLLFSDSTELSALKIKNYQEKHQH